MDSLEKSWSRLRGILTSKVFWISAFVFMAAYLLINFLLSFVVKELSPSFGGLLIGFFSWVIVSYYQERSTERRGRRGK